ncbi:MAG: RNA methyltransferase [Bacteroidales bacterium]|nr:RNA methyltransferase [Bacteroidales bacterium]MBN2762254.1 RNA methyltransferase [Bacteroidales bacterium]
MRKLANAELNRKSVEEYKKAEKIPVVVVLDNVRSLNNIGSVFRTCDAFLIESLFLCGITATPPHREIHKTALGATDAVNWSYFDKTNDALAQLRSEGYTLCAIEQTEKSIMLHHFRTEPGERYALVFGHEIHGVDQDIVNLCDLSIEIPQLGTKHSINIAVSAGIVLWEVFRNYVNAYLIKNR